MWIWKAVTSDLSGLGGVMGTERVYNSDLGYYLKVGTAKEKCQKHCEKTATAKVVQERKLSFKLKWIKEKDGSWCTDDLYWVMYRVKKILVET